MCPIAQDLRLRLRAQSCLDLDTSPFSVSLPKIGEGSGGVDIKGRLSAGRPDQEEYKSNAFTLRQH